MTEEKYYALGRPLRIQSSLSISFEEAGIDLDFGKYLSEAARINIEKIESFQRTSLHRARDFIMN